VVDDAEGLAATFDASIRATIESYQDPWREANVPATANQFASTLHPMDEAG